MDSLIEVLGLAVALAAPLGLARSLSTTTTTTLAGSLAAIVIGTVLLALGQVVQKLLDAEPTQPD